jgi:hypothetical protein
MNWNFWQKKKATDVSDVRRIKRQSKPRELPYEVGRHLVVEQGFDPDWIWNLKCVDKQKESSKSVFDIRIFNLETTEKDSMRIRDYDSLDNYMNLVIFAGWYDKETKEVRLEQLIEDAV